MIGSTRLQRTYQSMARARARTFAWLIFLALMAIPLGWHLPASEAVNAQPSVMAAEYTFEARIGASSDDAEESVSGSVSLNSSDLELVEVSGGAQTVGLRFRDVTIPGDAIVTSAYIQFQVDETSSGVTQLTIAGQAIDDAPTFASSGGDMSAVRL